MLKTSLDDKKSFLIYTNISVQLKLDTLIN